MADRQPDQLDAAPGEHASPAPAGTAVQLQQMVAAQDQVISVAAHELRSPLAALKLILQRIVRRAQRGVEFSGPKLTADLEPALRQAERLERLIGDLLDTGRLRRGRLELAREHVDLTALAQEVVATYAEHARQAGCAITIAAASPVVGSWDRSRLTQVTTNLLTNALKYGSGRPVLLRIDQIGDRGRLRISDQGAGIAAADRERIFEPFTRASERHREHSLGLGLYIVHQIIVAHGGRIWVQSAVPTGAEFVIELPILSSSTEKVVL